MQLHFHLLLISPVHNWCWVYRHIATSRNWTEQDFVGLTELCMRKMAFIGDETNFTLPLFTDRDKHGMCAEAEEEEEGESEKEEEDIFALEGETEHLNISTPGQPQEQPNQERIQGRGGWEGAARGAPILDSPA